MGLVQAQGEVGQLQHLVEGPPQVLLQLPHLHQGTWVLFGSLFMFSIRNEICVALANL
jgi:hypothetical protein